MFIDLCELYPKTHKRLKELALHKRDIYLHYMKAAKQIKDKTGPRIIATQSSMLQKTQGFKQVNNRMSRMIELGDTNLEEQSPLEFNS